MSLFPFPGARVGCPTDPSAWSVLKVGWDEQHSGGWGKNFRSGSDLYESNHGSPEGSEGEGKRRRVEDEIFCFHQLFKS